MVAARHLLPNAQQRQVKLRQALDMPDSGHTGKIASTMQDFPLTITHLLRHGQTVHGRSEVISFDGEQTSSSSFIEVAARMERLAAALAGLEVGPGDRVATLMWNSQEHLEAYFAVPCMGAVLHTLNLRLAPADLARIMAEAGDKVVMVHTSLLPLLSAVLPAVPSSRKGAGRRRPRGTGIFRWDRRACPAPRLRGIVGGAADWL